MPIGVLALQGDFREHIATLNACGADAVEVRSITELEKCHGLVIPGGESTVIEKLATNYGLFDPIKNMIMLADEIVDGIPGQRGFGGLDISVRRNAFGNQLDSFETDLDFAGLPGGKVHAAFIRAPIVERVAKEVEILSKLGDGRIVAVKSKNAMGISFHPEVTGEKRIHEMFLDVVNNA
jgi:5'-phosphate synthase pdxT subunit